MSVEIFQPAVLGVISSMVAGFVILIFSKFVETLNQKEKEKITNEAKKRITQIGLSLAGFSVSQKIEHGDFQEKIEVTDELISKIEEGVISKIASQGDTDTKNIDAQIDLAMDQINLRLGNIETRFPDKSSIDKIASINDALFAERIEQLSSRLSLLEEKQITKWEIATTVSLVFAGICTVAGTTYAALKALAVIS